MKKILAILLLGILLFNWVGYRFISDYFEAKAFDEMQANIDINNYSSSELISIKVPFSVPYGRNSIQFEKVSGSMEIKGVSYQYVKRRFYNDTLELLCLPNTAKTSVTNARDEFFKLANDFVNFSTSKKAAPSNHHLTKLSVQDYVGDHYFDIFQSPISLGHSYQSLSFSVDNLFYLQKLDQPPEA